MITAVKVATAHILYNQRNSMTGKGLGTYHTSQPARGWTEQALMRLIRTSAAKIVLGEREELRG